MQYNIDPVYPQNVVEETKKLTKGTITSRMGIEQVITIDPKGSKDLDDALNIECISDNEFVVGIHIADVASWVKKGYYIDLEARRRAVSFYPTKWRTIHMIPEPLSQNQCSLIEGENRQAISVYFRLNAEGEELDDPRIQKSVVNSVKQLTYQEAQEIIEGKWQGKGEKTEFVKNQVINLYKLSKSVRKVRLCDKMLHVPGEDCVEAHYLVEEFMIMANFFVAKLLNSKFPSGIPVRYQENPDNVSLIEWFNQYQTIGNVILNLQGNSCESVAGQHTLSLGTARGLDGNYVTIQKNVWKQIIDAIQNKDFEKARRFLCMDELHPGHFVARKKWENIMETAQYTCSAEEGINLNHFLLQKKPYTHFTSPIRRYVDLVVQRFIHAYLDGTSAPYTNQEIQELCIHLNERTKMQKQHQKETSKIDLAMDLGRHPVPFNGYISHTDDDGLQLQIPKWKFLSNQEVPFHLLDVCEKPEVKQDKYINGDITTTTWKKRSYHTLGTQVSVRPKLKPYEKLELDPNQNCVYLKISTWAKLISDVVGSLNVEIGQQNRKRHRKDAMEIVDSMGLDGQRPPVRFGTADIVSCEGGNNTTLLNLCRFSYNFAPGRLISAEMSSVIEKGIPTPKLSLLHLTKNLSFCLTHKENPVACLARFAHQSTSEATWQSVQDYIEAWHAVLEMEAAVTSASSGDETIFLEDVTIDFLGLRKGRFMLGLQFCIDRNIFGLDFAVPRKGTMTPISDFMCIRFAPEREGDRRFTWVAHGVMESISRDDDMLCVHFNLHRKASTLIPRCMMDGDTKRSFTIELLPRSKTDRRLKNALQPEKMNDAPLAKAIALNRPIPRLDGDHYHLGIMAERDISKDLQKRNNLPGNNVGQHEAIDKALTSSFTLIQGPPGTGKTYTGIKLAYLFAKINNIREIEKTGEKSKADEDEKKSQKHQVLYCGPSNKAVDVVARNLKNKLGEICPKIIRIYGSVIKNEDFPIPGQYISKSAVNREGRCPKDMYDISLHHVIRQSGKPYAKEIRKFDEVFRKERERPDSQGISAKIIRSYNKLVNEAERHELPNYDVILCTAAIAGSQKYTSATNIFQCIIDECGMCTEPESMLPIIETKAKQVVLIGDHKQLRPIVLCSEAAKLGLETSLFERYAERAVFLNRQYRMHPSICKFPSTQFYGGKLVTGDSLSWKIDRPLRFLPENTFMMFYHVEGVEESLTVHTDEGHEKSKSNTAEANKVIDLFLHMVRKEGCHPKSINIMTQYKSQMSLLQKRLKELDFDVTVNTVVASQGK
ncbi:helicase with zinc finger domain 2 [Patella vulgata]|uniref:helicase with zinc finger domain 2 n=1 Tax=Patella vulgata TaxID=6465 RepID=UPI00217F40DD|nr:helicase with zinc finger domain 2 [Patella vulgata]